MQEYVPYFFPFWITVFMLCGMLQVWNPFAKGFVHELPCTSQMTSLRAGNTSPQFLIIWLLFHQVPTGCHCWTKRHMEGGSVKDHRKLFPEAFERWLDFFLFRFWLYFFVFNCMLWRAVRLWGVVLNMRVVWAGRWHGSSGWRYYSFKRRRKKAS